MKKTKSEYLWNLVMQYKNVAPDKTILFKAQGNNASWNKYSKTQALRIFICVGSIQIDLGEKAQSGQSGSV